MLTYCTILNSGLISAATLPGLKLFPSQAVTHEREIITTHQGQETGRDEVISRTENTKDGGERGVEGPVSHLQIPHPLNSQGRTLIEELSSEVFASYDAEGGKQICNPEHTVIVIGGEELVKGRGGGGGDNDGDRGRRDVVKVTIKLPGVQDVKDVDLDVSEVSSRAPNDAHIELIPAILCMIVIYILRYMVFREVLSMSHSMALVQHVSP